MPLQSAKFRKITLLSSRCLQSAFSDNTPEPTSHLCKLRAPLPQILNRGSRHTLELYEQEPKKKVKNKTTEQYLPLATLFR